MSTSTSALGSQANQNQEKQSISVRDVSSQPGSSFLEWCTIVLIVIRTMLSEMTSASQEAALKNNQPTSKHQSRKQSKKIKAAALRPPSISSTWGAAALIVFLTGAAYANSFSGPFIFDDVQSISENPTIHALWPPWAPLTAPHDSGVTAAGRPVVNYTLALSYALSGFEVSGYHALNLAIHVTAALILFGILHRTFRQPFLREIFGQAAVPLGAAATLLWALHPIQTESVTYIIQRAEALAGLFYFLTLYGFLRATESARPILWYGLSIVACAIGLGAKEIVVTAPLIVFLYDRTFVAGSFAQAWRQRRGYYFGLACTWLVLAYLMSTTANRGNTMGFGMGVTSLGYFLTENRVIANYLGLALWPHPLCLDDYGLKIVTDFRQVVPQFFLLATLGGITLWLLQKRSAIGFVGAWFFLILAPSSSFVPIADVQFEHRMYEPLAGLLALAAALAYAWVGKKSYWIIGTMIVAYFCLTVQRNEDYQTEKSIWTQTVSQIPTSARAQNNLGNGYFHDGQIDIARQFYEKSLQLDPKYLEANNNLGVVLTQMGHPKEAIDQFRKTLKIAPFYPNALNNLANLLMESGQTEEALNDYAMAAAIDPNDANSRGNLANLLLKKGRREEAYTQFSSILQVDPDNAEANYHLGLLLAEDGRIPEGIQHFQISLRKQPIAPQVLCDYGMALMRGQQFPEAVEQLQRATMLAPDYAIAHSNLGNALFRLNRLQEAAHEFDEAIRSDPRLTDSYNDSAVVLVQLGQKAQAIQRLKTALKLSPHNLMAQSNLALLQGQAPKNVRHH